MNWTTTPRLVAITLVLALGFGACNSDDEGDGPSSSSFDRGPMLENLGTNVILPAYREADEAASQLETALEAFRTDPTESTLTAVRTQFETTWLAFQRAKIFEFGPASEVALRTAVNT